MRALGDPCTRSKEQRRGVTDRSGSATSATVRRWKPSSKLASVGDEVAAASAAVSHPGGRLVTWHLELPLFPQKLRRCRSASLRKRPATAVVLRSRRQMGCQSLTAVSAPKCRSGRSSHSPCKSRGFSDQGGSLRTGRYVGPVRCTTRRGGSSQPPTKADRLERMARISHRDPQHHRGVLGIGPTRTDVAR
jgi:hypothetical protein